MDAVGRELGFRKGGSCSLREETARIILHRVRNQGHPYVELRESGKRVIFFCTLCLSPCYSDSVLFDHLNGNLHKQRYAAAKVTLFGPMPWPFNDGVFFFHNLPKNEHRLVVSNSPRQRNGNLNPNNDSLEITVRDGSCAENSKSKHDDNMPVNVSDSNGSSNLNGCNSALILNDYREILDPYDDNHNLLIPGVLLNNEVSILAVRPIGIGHIASRIRETNEIGNRVSRIWCAWLGEGDSGDTNFLPAVDCDFAIITFSYTCDLGRKPVLNDLDLLESSLRLELENGGCNGNERKRKESFSEPEDMHEVMGDHPALSDSSEVVLFLQKDTADNAITSSQDNHHQLQQSRFISSKAVRRELRRQQRLVAERMCDVCQQKMLPGKDVATLLNRKTGNLACSSRNTNGAFHVFHTSCLIHWLLLCEFETLVDPSIHSEKTRGRTATKPRKRRATKSSKVQRSGDGSGTMRAHISSVFCPECQGTGINIEGDQLQKPTIPLSEMFLYKIKAIESHKAWMKNPEILQKCSTGLHFPCSSKEDFEEKVLPLKLLHFYRAIG